MQLVVARTDAPGVEVQAEPTALAVGEQTESTTQNQTSGSGTWIWLETTALTSPNLRYRYHSSHGSYRRPHPCSLCVPASSIHPWKSPHQIRLTLSQGVANTERVIVMIQAIANF